MIPYRYLPLAREELNEAAGFYETSVSGLGQAFLDDVQRAIEMVRENPRIGIAAGRVCPRHGGGGRPLNSVVSRHESTSQLRPHGVISCRQDFESEKSMKGGLYEHE